ncbi:MAG: GTPase [archaeon]
MGFNEIPKIENYKFYLDVAFKAGRTKASTKRGSIRGDNLNKAKILEFMKIETVERALKSRLFSIVNSFPNFDNLAEFYSELVNNLIEYDELKKSLGAMNWASKKIAEFSNKFKTSIRRSTDVQATKDHSKQYYGRISSVMRQISKNLQFLENTRKILRNFPSIKENMFTVAITGFPNIGKSTLLSKITSSRPEINSYSFTTKNLNVGYMIHGNQKIQFIDTPGTLNRLNKMNEIEKTAYLAIKYCAHMIIYVYDLSEPYPISEQKELLENLKELDKPIIVYLSKTDILDKKVVTEFMKKNKVIADIKILNEKILEEFKNY